MTGWSAIAGPRRDGDVRWGPRLAYAGLALSVFVFVFHLSMTCGRD